MNQLTPVLGQACLRDWHAQKLVDAKRYVEQVHQRGFKWHCGPTVLTPNVERAYREDAQALGVE